MIAMTPVLERGYTWWDRALFPRDEFEGRTRAVQGAMTAAGLDALVVWSQGYHTTGELAFLSGWPMGGAILLRPNGEPTLFSPGGGREQYFARMQTWVEDMRSTPGGMGKAIAKVLAEDGIAQGRLGMVGYEQMSTDAYPEVLEHLADYQQIDFFDTYRALLSAKRPREVIAIGNSLAIADQAIAAGVTAWEDGASNAEALVEAERVARVQRARDFRGLANITGKGLRPFERVDRERHERLLLWIGIDQHGYWAEAANGIAGSEANAAVDAMVAAAAPGTTAGAVAEAGLAALPEGTRDAALSHGLGSGSGLALDETPVIEPGSAARLVEGAVLTLRAVVPGSLAVATVRVASAGAERLQPT